MMKTEVDAEDRAHDRRDEIAAIEAVLVLVIENVDNFWTTAPTS